MSRCVQCSWCCASDQIAYSPYRVRFECLMHLLYTRECVLYIYKYITCNIAVISAEIQMTVQHYLCFSVNNNLYTIKRGAWLKH